MTYQLKPLLSMVLNLRFYVPLHCNQHTLVLHLAATAWKEEMKPDIPHCPSILPISLNLSTTPQTTAEFRLPGRPPQLNFQKMFKIIVGMEETSNPSSSLLANNNSTGLNLIHLSSNYSGYA